MDIHIEKKHLYAFIFFAVVLFGGIIVFASHGDTSLYTVGVTYHFLQDVVKNDNIPKESVDADNNGLIDNADDVTCDKCILNAKIGDSQVTSIKIGAGEIKSLNIGVGEVKSGNLDDGAVTNLKIEAGAIDDSKLAANSVKAVSIASNQVSNTHMTINSIDTNNIINGAVTNAKIGPSAVDSTKVAAGTYGISITGNAATATTATTAATATTATTANALAANGANCPAGQYPIGVDASGAVESCTPAAVVIGLDVYLCPVSSGSLAFEVDSGVPHCDGQITTSNSCMLSSYPGGISGPVPCTPVGHLVS